MRLTHPGFLAALVAIVAAAASLAACASSGGDSTSVASSGTIQVIRPDARLTPGDALPAGRVEICSGGYSKRVRDVSAQTKREIYAEYGITSHQPGEYEVDHLIPLGIGGSNAKTNLWPQPFNVTAGAKEKDQLENDLHNRVCDGRIDVKQAQREIALDWYAAYQKYVLNR